MVPAPPGSFRGGVADLLDGSNPQADEASIAAGVWLEPFSALGAGSGSSQVGFRKSLRRRIGTCCSCRLQSCRFVRVGLFQYD